MRVFGACHEKIKKIITNFALYLGRYRIIAVSYTHLTLPTIYSV